MADQKVQDPPSPAEYPKFLPLKKRTMAEKSLVRCTRAPESKSESESMPSSENSDDGDVINSSIEEVKEQTLQELQIKAYYSVLQAFIFGTSTMSNKRTQIVKQLMNEWKISDETHISFADMIQKDLVARQQMDDSSSSDENEMQIEQEKPLTKSATSSSNFVSKSGPSWGSVKPESLIGKWVCIRFPDEAEFEEFIIKEYDRKQDMHRLETLDSNAMETDDQLNWIDLREILDRDIMWQGGEKPNFRAPNQSTVRRVLF